MLLLALIVAVALGQGGNQITTALTSASSAISIGDISAGRVSVVTGLNLIRERARALLARRSSCDSGDDAAGCRREIVAELMGLRGVRGQFRRLETCARLDGGERVDCVKTTMEKAFSVAATTVTTTLAPGAEVQPVREAVASAIAGGAPKDQAGDDAVAALAGRLQALAASKAACKDRKCRKNIRSERRKLRMEARLLARIERCVARFQDGILRARCIAKFRPRLLALLGGATSTTTTSSKPDLSTPFPEVVVARVANVVDAAANGTPIEAITSEQAIASLRRRVSSISASYAKCKELNGAQKRECRRVLDENRSVNRRERKLVHRLDKCAHRFRTNEARRKNCVARVARKLMPLVHPIPAARVPGSVEAIKTVEETQASDLNARLEQLRRDLANCDTTMCRDQVRNAILTVRVELHSMDKRFSPRRECLRKRREVRSTEFRARALEHMRLYRLHRRAARCDTRRCAAHFTVLQHEMEASIRSARSVRLALWNSLRCPLVGETTTEISTTLTTETITESTTVAATDASTSATDAATSTDSTTTVESTSTEAPRTPSPANARRAELHLRLNQLYLSLDNCADKACKKAIRKDISAVKKELKTISQSRKRLLLRERSRHLRRARLHRRLSRVYKRYASCRSHACRVKYSTVLAKFQEALERLNRNILGSKEETGKEVVAGIESNVYTEQLAKSLNDCAADDAKCRKAILKAFRRQNEERDRAVLQMLAKQVKDEVATRVAACAVGASRESCVAEVQKWEADRLADLQSHLIKLEERRALRMCESMPDLKVCRDTVKKEFKKDEKVAVSKAAEAAATEVSQAIASIAPSIGAPVVSAQGVVSPGRSANASVLAVGAVALLSVLLFLL